MKYLLVVLFLAIAQAVGPLAIHVAAAQEESVQPLPGPSVVPRNTVEHGNGKVAGVVSLMSNREFWLSCIILIFGILIVVIEYFLLREVVRDKTEEIARTYTVTLIIIGTLVLISSGFTNEQIAPALGLFGTIAGYLLGRGGLKRKRSNASEGEDDEA